MVLFAASLFSLELLKTKMPNNLKVAIEVLLGKDKRENKLKLISVYHWETKTKKDQNPSELIYFADFIWILKHPSQSGLLSRR